VLPTGRYARSDLHQLSATRIRQWEALPGGKPSPQAVGTRLGLGELRDPPPRRGSAAVLLDVIDRVLDGADFLRVLVRNVDLEGLLEGEHELDQAERVRS